MLFFFLFFLDKRNNFIYTVSISYYYYFQISLFILWTKVTLDVYLFIIMPCYLFICTRWRLFIYIHVLGVCSLFDFYEWLMDNKTSLATVARQHYVLSSHWILNKCCPFLVVRSWSYIKNLQRSLASSNYYLGLDQVMQLDNAGLCQRHLAM